MKENPDLISHKLTLKIMDKVRVKTVIRLKESLEAEKEVSKKLYLKFNEIKKP